MFSKIPANRQTHTIKPLLLQRLEESGISETNVGNVKNESIIRWAEDHLLTFAARSLFDNLYLFHNYRQHLMKLVGLGIGSSHPHQENICSTFLEIVDSFYPLFSFYFSHALISVKYFGNFGFSRSWCWAWREHSTPPLNS